MKNKDIRVCALEHGVKLWEVAKQLGISPETMSRRLRWELTAEEKERMVCQGHQQEDTRRVQGQGRSWQASDDQSAIRLYEGRQ